MGALCSVYAMEVIELQRMEKKKKQKSRENFIDTTQLIIKLWLQLYIHNK
jgi:hypothetical protein